MKIQAKYIAGEWETSLNENSHSSIQLNVVSAVMPCGIPARFFAGFIPVVSLANTLKKKGAKVCVRIFSPASISSHFNGWGDMARIAAKANDLAGEFFKNVGIECLIDPALPVTKEVMELLAPLADAVQKAPELAEVRTHLVKAGFRYGGKEGRSNCLLYAAAHPFGWQDMWHPAIWEKKPCGDSTIINVMSPSEEPFLQIRNFLKKSFPYLVIKETVNLFTTVCKIPHYIKIEGEPFIETLFEKGVNDAELCYEVLLLKGGNINRAESLARDFRSIKLFYQGR